MNKKGAEPAPKVVLGRPSNNLKMGIVGLPNVGKSTLFNILTKMNVPAENFPFCTIQPAEKLIVCSPVGRVAVPDERFDFLCEFHKPASRVPAYLTIIDIAGLVRGASKGEGLGNAFLSNIRAVDGIFHVIRIFEEAEVTHVEGSVDPIRDMEIIHEELLLKDIEFMEKQVDEMTKHVARIDKTKKPELDIMLKVQEMLKNKRDVRLGDWNTKEVEVINTLTLLTAKPVVYLVNMSEADYISKKNRWLGKIKQWIDARNPDAIVPFCADFEKKLVDLDNTAAAALCKESGCTTAIPKLIRTGYHALELGHYFTAGADEVRAWTVRVGTKAPQAAGIIHTDFEKGFICAETMKFVDFKEAGSESACKAAGKCMQKGREYVVCDGDILFFKFNAASGGKAKK